MLVFKKLLKVYKNFKNRTYCFCGNSYGLYGKSNFCTVPCAGNISQICGGDYAAGKYANDIYLTALSKFVSYRALSIFVTHYFCNHLR